MASSLLRTVYDGTVRKVLGSCVNLIPVRFKTHRKFPSKKRINPFVQRRTDLIKKLVIALVQYERIQTTYHKAVQLKKYGDLLIQLSLRRRPPPDLDMIENGFVLTDTEAREKMIKPRIINRMSKRVIIYPQVPCEEEYLVRCRKEASNMLLGDQNALEKLYGPLKERYEDRYGNFVRIARIPNPPNPTFPNMAYVELVGNSLPPLPEMPAIKEGKWVVYGDDEKTEETALVQSQ